MGGSFNPPTLAHYRLMKEAVDALDADIGFFVPVSDAYLKRKMRHSHPPVVLSPDLRVKMLQSMCTDSRMRVCEQYMMASKARLFGDDEVCQEIMMAYHPNEYKKLGRKVRGFNPELWDERKYDIVVEGNKAKFGQNDDIREFLLSTGDAILVEASPYDKIWGIGLDRETAMKGTVQQWQGENLLGCALMETRDWLRNIK